MRYLCPLCKAVVEIDSPVPSLRCPKCSILMVEDKNICQPGSAEGQVGSGLLQSEEQRGLKIARPLTVGVSAGREAMETQPPDAALFAGRQGGPEFTGLHPLGASGKTQSFRSPTSCPTGLETQVRSSFLQDKISPVLSSVPLSSDIGGAENVFGENSVLSSEACTDWFSDPQAAAAAIRLLKKEYWDCRHLLEESEERNHQLEERLGSEQEDSDGSGEVIIQLQRKHLGRSAIRCFCILNFLFLGMGYSLLMGLNSAGWQSVLSWCMLALQGCIFLGIFGAMISCVHHLSVLSALVMPEADDAEPELSSEKRKTSSSEE